MTDYEKEAHAGQSNIRLSFAIVAPVLGRVEMVPTALLHDSRCSNTAVSATKPVHAQLTQAGNLFPLFASARVHLAQAAKPGADIIQLAAQLGHDAFPRAVEARTMACATRCSLVNGENQRAPVARDVAQHAH